MVLLSQTNKFQKNIQYNTVTKLSQGVKKMDDNKPDRYDGVKDAIGGLEPSARAYASIAYLASQVELADLPPDAKKPFYAAIEAWCRDSPEQNKSLAKLADFYAKKLEEKT